MFDNDYDQIISNYSLILFSKVKKGNKSTKFFQSYLT